MKHVLSLLLSFFLTGLIWAKKPNVVFLVSEDNSVHYLKHYGAKFGSMPHVEKMAEEGLTFNHAFQGCVRLPVPLSPRAFWPPEVAFSIIGNPPWRMESNRGPPY